MTKDFCGSMFVFLFVWFIRKKTNIHLKPFFPKGGFLKDLYVREFY